MILLDGKKASSLLIDRLKNKINKLDRKLNIAIIDIAGDDRSNIYIKSKIRICKYLDIGYNVIRFNNKCLDKDIIKVINKLNKDKLVDGIIIELPIPNKFNTRLLIDSIDPTKDIDCLTTLNIGKLNVGNNIIAPCTPSGIINLLNYYKIDVKNKNIVILGRSELVGKPLATMLTERDATVTLCHSKTTNLKNITRNADILISAIGKPKFITGDFIKNDSVIIDVGINYIEGKIYGDIDFDSVKNKVSYITPVPGGIGPMTVYEFVNNSYQLYKNKKGNNDV